MPSIIYMPDPVSRTYGKRDIDPTILKDQYFVRLSSDKRRLLPGVLLTKSEVPAVGSWLELGKIDRDFEDRYFVQYTDFNTLVPGSLIEGERLPKGKWKEVKAEPAINPYPFIYHHVKITNGYRVGAHEGEKKFIVNSDTMTSEVLFPIFDHYYPGLRQESSIQMNSYYSVGSFDQIDLAHMDALLENIYGYRSLGDTGAFIQMFNEGDTLYPEGSLATDYFQSLNMEAMPNALDGNYNLIMQVYYPLAPQEIIILENVITKYTIY